jgi:hypothetical protein
MTEENDKSTDTNPENRYDRIRREMRERQAREQARQEEAKRLLEGRTT